MATDRLDSSRDGEMVQLVKALAAKTYYLSLRPETYMVEGVN